MNIRGLEEYIREEEKVGEKVEEEKVGERVEEKEEEGIDINEFIGNLDRMGIRVGEVEREVGDERKEVNKIRIGKKKMG
jgi:hypothetical protein